MYTVKTTKNVILPIEYIKENFYVNYTKLFPRFTTEKFDINYINNDLNIVKTIKANENIYINITKFTFNDLIDRKILIKIDDSLYAPSYLLNYIVTSTNAIGYIKYVKRFLHKVETYEMKKKHKDELSKTKSEYESQIDDLTESKSKYKDELSQTKSKYESQINELSKTKSKYESQIDDLTKIKSSHETQINDLTKSKSKYESKIDELSKTKSKYESKIDELSQTKSKYETQIDELSKTKSKYESQIDDLTKSKSKLESNLKFVKEAHEDFKTKETKKMTDLKLEMKSKDIKINDLTKIKSTHEKQINELSQTKSKYESKIDDLTKIKTTHEKQINELSQTKSKYETEINELSQTKSKYENQIDDLTKIKSTNEKRINDLTKIKSTNEKRIEELSQTNSEYESQIDTLTKTNEDLKTDNQLNSEKIKDLELIIQDQFEIINGFRYAANLLMGTSSSSKHTIRVVSKNDELYYFFGQHLDPIDVEYTLEFEETIICSHFEFQGLVNILIQKYNIKFNSKTNHIKIDITKKDQIINEFKRELYKLNNQLSKPNPDYNAHNIQESLNEIKGEVKEIKEKVYDFVITQQQHALLLNSFVKQKGRWRKIKQDIKGKYYINYGTKDRETHYLSEAEIKSKLY